MGSGRRQVLATMATSAEDLITKRSPTAIHKKQETSLFQTQPHLMAYSLSLLSETSLTRLSPTVNHLLQMKSLQLDTREEGEN